MTATEYVFIQGLVSFSLVILEKLVVFYLAYRIVCIGAGLLEKGITGEFKFKSSWAGARADLVSASPGLLFLLLGVLLLGYAIGISKVVQSEYPHDTPRIAEPTVPKLEAPPQTLGGHKE